MLAIGNTNDYDNVTLENIWNRVDNPHIVLGLTTGIVSIDKNPIIFTDYGKSIGRSSDLPKIHPIKNNRYKVGDVLVPLTIEKIRRNYYNSITGGYNRIEHFDPQSSADRLRIVEILSNKELKVREEYDDPEEQRDMETRFPDQMILTVSSKYFTPNGNLISVDRDDQGKRTKKVKRGWLQSGEPGPYLHGAQTPFYYLDGKLADPRFSAQVCAGPVNVVSYDCLDDITMWVLDD